MQAQATVSVALVCDDEARILEVVESSLPRGRAFAVGTLLVSSVAEGSRAKALDFLVAVRAQGVTLGWELNVALGDHRIEPLWFGGGVHDGRLLIVACVSRDEVERCYRSLVERRTTLDAAGEPVTPPHAPRDAHLYDELSRMNNELVNAHRELARTYAELARARPTRSEDDRFVDAATLARLADREAARARRRPAPCTVVALEIPNGGAPAQTARRADELATVCAASTRAVDALARDEAGRTFLLLPETPALGARQLVARIRGQLRARGVDAEALRAGVAELAGPQDDGTTLLTRASANLGAETVAVR